MGTVNDRLRIVIMGAGGRDFHNFNVIYRDDPQVEVVAFTAAQIPGISGRTYPPELAGPHYPEGIPIVDESDLADLCRRESIDRVVFAYSDISYDKLMRAASRSMSTGALRATGTETQHAAIESPRHRSVRSTHRVRKVPNRALHRRLVGRMGFAGGHHSSPHALR